MGIRHIVLVIVFISAGIMADKSTDVKREQYFVKGLKKNPNDLTLRYEYAVFLYSLERFKKAKTQLNKVLKKRKPFPEGEALLSHMNEIENIKDFNVRRQKMAKFIIQQEQKRLQAQAPIRKPPKSFLKKVEKRRKSLDKRYGITKNFKNRYIASIDEINLAGLIAKYTLDNNYRAAQKLHIDRMGKYPKSPAAKADYIRYLIERDRLSAASKQLKSAKKQFPKNVRLKMLGESLAKVQGASTIQQKKVVLDEMSQNLADYATIEADYLLKQTRRKPTETKP